MKEGKFTYYCSASARKIEVFGFIFKEFGIDRQSRKYPGQSDKFWRITHIPSQTDFGYFRYKRLEQAKRLVKELYDLPEYVRNEFVLSQATEFRTLTWDHMNVQQVALANDMDVCVLTAMISFMAVKNKGML